MTSGDGVDGPALPGLADGFFDSAQGRALIRRINAVPSDRTVLAVAGAPGSGKSTLAEALVARLPDAVLVPMDGFHLDDRVLEERGLLERKGAVETFDAEGFAVLAGRLAQPGGDIVFPVFDRSRELAVAGAGVVAPSHRVVVVEGNYLLLDRPPWNRVRYDLSVWLDVPLPELRRRLEARWHALGKDEAGVAAHLANDLANAQIASTASRAADVVLVGEVAHQEPGQG